MYRYDVSVRNISIQKQIIETCVKEYNNQLERFKIYNEIKKIVLNDNEYIDHDNMYKLKIHIKLHTIEWYDKNCYINHV